MAKIFYGNGECEVVGKDIVLCQLMVRYPIEIDDKSPEGFFINAKNNMILILKMNLNKGVQLKEMFSYIGALNITAATVINKDGEKEHPVIKRVMDYTELLTTNTEDMTTLSENLKAKNVHVKRISKMKLLQPHIENMHTGEGSNYYLKDGSAYSGYFHIHIEDNRHMTGATHTEESLDLYFKDTYKGHVNEELILYNFNNVINTRHHKMYGRESRRRR